jgi:hypothetical protein
MIKEKIMANDFITSVIIKELKKAVEKSRKQGMSENEIQAKIESIDMGEILEKVVGLSSKNCVEYFRKTMFEKVLEERAITNEFLARHDQIWGKAFVTSEAMYVIACETGEMFGNYIKGLDDQERKSYTYRFSTLQSIHARACQIYLEILTLIKNGLADGAFARWRSLFEISVISNFISIHSEKVAHAYYEASESDGKWYDWARPAGCFKGQDHITFKMIWINSGLITPEWETEYDLSNCIVHASPQGTYKRMGTYKPTGVLSAGYSDYGVAVPASHAAMSLAFTTSRFLSLHSYGDGLVHQHCLLKWIDVVQEAYSIAEKEHFYPKRKAVAKRMDGTKIKIKA